MLNTSVQLLETRKGEGCAKCIVFHVKTKFSKVFFLTKEKWEVVWFYNVGVNSLQRLVT